jgi:hypothetical protein
LPELSYFSYFGYFFWLQCGVEASSDSQFMTVAAAVALLAASFVDVRLLLLLRGAASVELLAAAFEDVPLLLLKTWWILICSAKHVIISREERTAPRQGFRKTRVHCHNACNAGGQE